MAKVIECRSDLDYQGAIGNAGNNLVLVEFFAGWTTPSQVISNELGVIRMSFPRIAHVRVNFDECPVTFI